MNLTKFTTTNFLPALKSLFQELQVPVNYLTDEPASAKTILKDTYKDNETFNLIDDIYFLGMVDDAAFSKNDAAFINNDDAAGSTAEHKSMEPAQITQIKSNIKSDYDGVLIFGITLKQRENSRLPTRSRLAQIARAFNREFFYTPVVAVFKYDKYLAFANTERLKYKQEWREGEKAGKVTLLRDIDLKNPHAGHLRILNDLKLPKTGKNKVDSFATLYSYWQDVFSANILNKKFYQELSNWYFWAIKEVTFPSEPTEADAHLKKIELAALKQEHNAKNVIRLLTRFLFVWFIKEQKLIPEELFDMQYLTNDLLKNMNFVCNNDNLFQEANKESIYYKAVLQNLFFASLNCPIEPYEKGDNRKRGFRLKDNFGQHRDANYLMRYQDYFKNPDNFLELINSVVPFLNGGLFECLDNKTDKIYIDGFSDNLINPHQLVVPDYLFFGFDQKVDLTEIVGINSKAYKNAKVKGLISILESYKFTVAENTPIEEDVALDPELLGKVFENLLASYNPETKTTARKQTGSFYTPREIVNYMVDESLIAYLKTSVKDWGRIEEQELDNKLHELFSYNEINPFAQDEAVQKQIIHALDNCKILDPACGSGAFPMGTLQKMVHILQKVDPDNKHWQELQLNKAVKETEGAFALADKKEREQKLIEINEAFDEKINDPDYARKLFLVENCIYGVDIQPIATQISKLRFFISLVVDQKVDREKPNFGIRALPNLETKFVAANTLIGIDKPDTQMNLFDNQEIKALEQELKNVRHRLFSAKSPATKRKLRDKDKEIREKIGNLLVEHGWANETAKQLAAWDPYNQNDFSPFFDPEWMFGIADGFDVVIGNPPYGIVFDMLIKAIYEKKYITFKRNNDIYAAFLENSLIILNKNGHVNFITPNTYLNGDYFKELRKYLKQSSVIHEIVDFKNAKIFQDPTVFVCISLLHKSSDVKFPYDALMKISNDNFTQIEKIYITIEFNDFPIKPLNTLIHNISKSKDKFFKLEDKFFVKDVGFNYWTIGKGKKRGGNSIGNRIFYSGEKECEQDKPFLKGKDIAKFCYSTANNYLRHDFKTYLNPEIDIFRYSASILETTPKIIYRQTSNKIIATIDSEKNLCDKTVHIVIAKNELDSESIFFLLALMNSKLFDYFYKDISQELEGRTFAQVKTVYIKQLPIVKTNKQIELIGKNIVIYIILLKKINIVSNFFESLIDSIVYELYLPDKIKAANADVLKYLNNLPELKEDWSDEKKIKTIQKVYQELSNQNNPVFIAMERQKNVNEVRLIEGLDNK